MSRPFNLNAYKAFDHKNKETLVELMHSKGYKLVGNINEEHYKKYDLKFVKDGKEISFENETRLNFIRIKNSFSTIHIPIRKQNTQADYYIVWKPEMDEFFLIEKKLIEEYKTQPITLYCQEYKENDGYVESFIDIPKDKAKLFIKVNNSWVSNKLN